MDAARGCAAIDASFCDDFDDGGAPMALWQPNGDAQARSLVAGFSLPWALGVSVPTSSDTSYLAIDLPGAAAPKHATFSFAINVHAAGALTGTSGDEIGVAVFGPTHINNQPNLRVVVKGTLLKLVQFDPTQGDGMQYWTVSSFPFVTDQWLRIAVDVDWASSPAALAVSVNGTKTIDQPLHFANFPTPTSPALIVGAFYSIGLDAGAPWSFAYDDVAFLAR